jgi:D-glycero-beta-D-manno-heptose 1-phosphate adenylyltransferase
MSLDLDPPVFFDKVLTLADQAVLAELPRPWVFTNGCFDILHIGHVSYLAQAAGLGASLIVGVNSDDSVRRLEKGSERPLNNLADRAGMLASLASVSAVIAFEEDTPMQLIQALRPDVLVKGGDWDVAKLPEAQWLIAQGGEAHAIPFIFDRSTTALVTKIKSAL